MAAGFGAQGTRYDEDCERCGRTGAVDNTSGCCKTCHVQYMTDRETLRQAASPEMARAAEFTGRDF